jgi:hypothetical protein
VQKTKFLTGFSEKLFGSAKRKTQDLIRQRSEKLISKSLGGFALQFASFIPRTFLPDAASDQRKRVFTSEVVFWAWMSQVLSFNSSCSDAVGRVQAWRLQAKLSAISSKTTAYCNARIRLSLTFIQTVSSQVLSVLNRRVQTKDLWNGFIVKSVDGSSVQLMDTEENQKEFPQPTNQKKHCGFPVMKFLGLLNHCTGAWENHLTAHPNEHDARTMKKLLSYLIEPCLLLADRAFCSYEIILRLRNQGVESVMRLHQMRAKGFTLRKGKRIGPHQRLVTWIKPKEKPKHSDMNDQEWDELEGTIQMRLIACFYEDRNGEKKRMILATTLLDPQKYDWLEIMNLYATRWDIELRIRDVKTTMGMEELNVKTPEMARKSLAMALLGYNLVKAVSQEASQTEGVDRRMISFKGVLDWINITTALFQSVKGQAVRSLKNLYASFLETAATKLIDHRPYRWEPRAIKKRPKPFPRLTESRSGLRAQRELGNLIPA